jgi:hypothetical protein
MPLLGLQLSFGEKGSSTRFPSAGSVGDTTESAGFFLASDASSYVTGSILTVYGGWTRVLTEFTGSMMEMWMFTAPLPKLPAKIILRVTLFQACSRRVHLFGPDVAQPGRASGGGRNPRSPSPGETTNLRLRSVARRPVQRR